MRVVQTCGASETAKLTQIAPLSIWGGAQIRNTSSNHEPLLCGSKVRAIGVKQAGSVQHPDRQPTRYHYLLSDKLFFLAHDAQHEANQEYIS